MTKTFPGEFSRDVGKWKRGMISDLQMLTRGIKDANGKEHLPSAVLDERPPKTISVVACPASENMVNTLDDSYVCWKDSNGILVASEKLNYTPARRSARNNASSGGDGNDSWPTIRDGASQVDCCMPTNVPSCCQLVGQHIELIAGANVDDGLQ